MVVKIVLYSALGIMGLTAAFVVLNEPPSQSRPANANELTREQLVPLSSQLITVGGITRIPLYNVVNAVATIENRTALAIPAWSSLACVMRDEAGGVVGGAIAMLSSTPILPGATHIENLMGNTEQADAVASIECMFRG